MSAQPPPPTESSEARGGSGFAITALVLGILGLAIGLVSSVIDYELPLLLGILALVFGILAIARKTAGRGMAIAGTVLGVLALGLGLIGYASFNDAFEGIEGLEDTGETEPTASERATAKREDFCKSSKGDALERAGFATTDSGAELRAVTRKALDAAESAPAGADCAVTALDSIVSSWNLFAGDPGYQDAEEQVSEIRSFQGENKLKKARY
jgi:hypothetical protein